MVESGCSVANTDLWDGSFNLKTAPKNGTTSGNDGEHGNLNSAQKLLHANNQCKISVGRCAQLIISSNTG